jgi:hypothetical protein
MLCAAPHAGNADDAGMQLGISAGDDSGTSAAVMMCSDIIGPQLVSGPGNTWESCEPVFGSEARKFNFGTSATAQPGNRIVITYLAEGSGYGTPSIDLIHASTGYIIASGEVVGGFNGAVRQKVIDLSAVNFPNSPPRPLPAGWWRISIHKPTIQFGSTSQFTLTIDAPGEAAPSFGQIGVVGSFFQVPINNHDDTPREADATDFGDVDVGRFVVHPFGIRNTGNDVLHVIEPPQVDSGGNSFSIDASLVPSEIAPGGAGVFTIIFRPTEAGLQQARVSIVTSDPDDPVFEFTVEGRGISTQPELDVRGNGMSIASGRTTASTSDGTDFGQLEIDAPAVTRRFTIHNTGGGPLVLNAGVAISGLAAADFAVVAQPPTQVAAGSSASFDVRFTPTASGTRAARIELRNNDADEGVYTFTISGIATVGGAPEIVVIGNDGSELNRLDLTPSVRDGTEFGPVRLSERSGVHYFSIRNDGDAPLVLGGSGPAVELVGSGVPDFELVPASLPGTIAPGEAFPLAGVRFRPAALDRRFAFLVIRSNDADEPMTSILLAGTGIGAPDIAVLSDGVHIPSRLDRPTIVPQTLVGGQANVRTFSIQNLGTEPLELTGMEPVSITGDALDDPIAFRVTTPPRRTIEAGAAAQFQLEFSPLHVGLHLATVRIEHNVPGVPPYEFRLWGTGGDANMISGAVFEDRNKNGRRDEGESGLAGVRIMLDNNGDGVFDEGIDDMTSTDAEGMYAFRSVFAGRHYVQLVNPPVGRRQTSPDPSIASDSLLYVYQSFAELNDDRMATIRLDGTIRQNIGLTGADSESRFGVQGLAFDSINRVLYGILDRSDVLFQFDLETGAATRVGSLGRPFTTGLTYSPIDNRLYGMSQGTLVRVDPRTLTTEVVNRAPLVGDATTLVYEPLSGMIYAHANVEPRWQRFHPYTFKVEAAPLMNPNVSSIHAADHDGESILFVTTDAPGNLYRYDTLDGTTELLFETGMIANGMAYVPAEQQSGRYHVIVAPGQRITGRDFGLAAVPTSPGDYNGNGAVDAADYVVWRKRSGQTGAPGIPGDGSGPTSGVPDGVVDERDYDWWKVNFGKTIPAAAGSSGRAATTYDAAADRDDGVLRMRAAAFTRALSDLGSESSAGSPTATTTYRPQPRTGFVRPAGDRFVGLLLLAGNLEAASRNTAEPLAHWRVDAAFDAITSGSLWSSEIEGSLSELIPLP